MMRGSRDSFSETMKRIDSSDMKSDMDAWPELAKDSWNSVEVPSVKGDFDSVALIGMGGSGIVGEIITDIANEKRSDLHFHVVREFHLPPHIDKKTLIVGISCSGNTKETLRALSEATKMGLNAFTFGSGGALRDLSRDNRGFRFTKTTMLKSPRSSFPAIFYPVLKFFSKNGIIKIKQNEVLESLDALSRVRSDSKDPGDRRNEALRLAKQLIGGERSVLPLIYSSSRTKAAGMRFRQSLNETAKLHAFNGEVPELCHNEIVPWNPPGRGAGREEKYVPVMLRLADDPFELQVNFDILKENIIGRKAATIDAPYIGRGYLGRVLSMLYYLDYAAYYTAILRGVDPMEIPSINRLKEQLNKRLGKR